MLFCWIVFINKLISLWCFGVIILLMKIFLGGLVFLIKYKDYKMFLKLLLCDKLYYDRSDKFISLIIFVGFDDIFLGDRKK